MTTYIDLLATAINDEIGFPIVSKNSLYNHFIWRPGWPIRRSGTMTIPYCAQACARATSHDDER
eukprot:SAG31_NODE_34659_length_330_cov_2.337662_1_plen_64_part_00